MNASKVRELRREQGISRERLAAQAGLAVRTVASLEAGGDVKLSTLAAIARVLDVPVEHLLQEGDAA